MGDCKSCKDCSCDSAEKKKPKHYGNPNQSPGASRYLERQARRGPQPDPTPLNARCPHYQMGSALRSQCTLCIASWVRAVGRDEAERAAAEFDNGRRSIAGDRIRRAVVEFLDSEAA